MYTNHRLVLGSPFDELERTSTCLPHTTYRCAISCEGKQVPSYVTRRKTRWFSLRNFLNLSLWFSGWFMRWSNSHLPAVLYTRRGEHWQTDPRRTGRVGMIINSTSVSLGSPTLREGDRKSLGSRRHSRRDASCQPLRQYATK